MHTNKIDGINFQAKLNISKVKTNKQRWYNIKNLFKEVSKKYPRARMEIVEYAHETHINGLDIPDFPYVKKINAIAPNQIVNKLLEEADNNLITTKLFKLLDAGEETETKICNINRKYKLTKDENIFEIAEKRFTESQKIIKSSLEKLRKDSFWKDFDIDI